MVRRDILLAFSGGIDSCAAVKLLQSEGYAVQGVTIDMMGDEEFVQQALRSAESLGIKLHIVDARQKFEQQIVRNFINEYLSGRTPAPCTRCNTLIKWELLAKKADELGIYYIATGHYFRIQEIDGVRYVSRAADPQKDQSYYLWGVKQEILSRAITPMGEQIKAKIKETSENKRESMGVCFLKGEPYAQFICSRCGELTSGEVVNMDGEVVGEHNGVARYTIGQRRGEGIPAGARVVSLDAEQNQIVVGDNAILYHRSLFITDCYFANIEELTTSTEIKVMIRGIGLNPTEYATVNSIKRSLTEGLTATVELSDPSWAAAAGQPIVLYIGDRVVGGGYLKYAK